MSKAEKKNSVYFPNLDALRFFAFFFVFVNHTAACFGHRTSNVLINNIKSKYLYVGDLGVNFFLVLGGFLITFLLLKEKEESNRIHVGHFYLRRILRIWPLYFLVLIIGLYLIPFFSKGLPVNFPVYSSTFVLNKNLYFLFLGNFDYLINGVSNYVVGVLWSVSVEEQFYLFWPLLLFIIPKRHLTKVFIGLILFSVLYRLFGTSGLTLNLMLKYHTFSCISDLAMGALFAQLCTNEKYLNAFINLKKHWIDIIYSMGFLLIIFRVDLFNLEPVNTADPRLSSHILKSILPVFYSLFFAFIIIEQVYAKNSIFKIGRIKMLTKLGKVSYGLYCFHLIAMFFVAYAFLKLGYNAIQPDKYLLIVEVIASLLLTIVLASISYNFYEKKFLKLKEKF